ncbi:universal stress protein [Kitasatospora aureofaciens]|uniref:Universal stress protein A n=1 Tax=Kitasatospora aureofaciens TaxID=1894 RepID=A0A8H9HMS5_KITAU|nr:universal stress protein [Kitasatospora aureofaciens]ARF82355.1 universal stress protein UspA [Kitasatospora aureofaciens]QEU98232.1 universal stress protein [Streptomyces viridifaciens]UKZ04128.1 universal stress protein [Streptomyces viridifaciens]GGU70801.1 universal stress protein A [Kitasatospora aureofaciens]
MSNESDAADAGAVDGASRPDGEAQAGNEEHVGHEPAVAPGGFELGTDGPKVILAGLDGSDSSWRAIAYAAGLARRQGALLAVAYVQPILGAATALAGAAVEETTQEIADELLAALREAEQRVREVWRVQWRFLTMRGDPYTGLAKLADELRADAVVVGVSEQAGHKVIGSVAVRLVKAGRWPVTVVP